MILPAAGLRNQKISIYKYDDTDDGATGSKPVRVLYWATVAKVSNLRAKRTLEAAQERLDPRVIFDVRYRNDKFVTEDMVLVWRGVTFTIQDAVPDFVYKRVLSITAKAPKLPAR